LNPSEKRPSIWQKRPTNTYLHSEARLKLPLNTSDHGTHRNADARVQGDPRVMANLGHDTQHDIGHGQQIHARLHVSAQESVRPPALPAVGGSGALSILPWQVTVVTDVFPNPAYHVIRIANRVKMRPIARAK